MADLTTTQHDQLRKWFRTLRDSMSRPDKLHYVKESPNPQHSSAALAFTGIGLLNLPGFALIYALKFAAARDLAKKLNQLVGTFAGRSITEISTVLRTREVALGIASQEEFSRAAHWWITRIGFSAQGLREGYFWTIITSCFFHLEFLHLLRSLIGIYEFSGPCAQIPGMNAWHVGVVTVGSCIVTNLFGLVQYSGVLSTARGAPPLPMQACGGSGIVAAFMGIAVMYKPLERVGWGVAGTTITVPLWVYSGLFVFGNAFSLSMTLGIVNLPLLGAHPHVAYAAHLSGAAFGAVYYWMILQPRVKLAETPIASKRYSQPLRMRDALDSTADGGVFRRDKETEPRATSDKTEGRSRPAWERLLSQLESDPSRSQGVLQSLVDKHLIRAVNQSPLGFLVE